jgi:peptide/nickel transport system substrate-binding protein
VPRPTDGGRTYTFHIRQGVKWHAPSGDRQVTAQDFVLGFKRLCNPVSPTGAPGYFEPTIVGMQSYCDGFAKVAQTVPAIKRYISTHQIAGVTATDAQTLVIKLTAPVADFLNILAMPFCSATPVEYLNYLPDSPQFRQHTISDGPYVITSYQPKQSMRLDRNPAWDPKTDPLRKAWVDSMQITMGVSEEAVAQQLQAGTTDLYFSSVFPVSDVRKVKAANDPKLGYAPTGDTWYIDINLLSPNAGGALRKLAVRQALNYAVDKRHVIQQLGGPTIAAPQDTILTPTLEGYRDVHPYGTKPDIAKAKQLLRQAGYPNGLTLKFLYPTDATREVQLFTVLQQDYKAAGIRLKAVPVATTDEFYASYLEHPHDAKSGVWDLALPGWIPDWSGNGARSIFVPLLDGRRFGEGSTNYGDYSDPAVDKLVDKALHETDRATETAMFAKADAMVMRDAPWVPLYTEFYPTYHSARVRGYVYFPEAYNADFTNVWLAS